MTQKSVPENKHEQLGSIIKLIFFNWPFPFFSISVLVSGLVIGTTWKGCSPLVIKSVGEQAAVAG